MAFTRFDKIIESFKNCIIPIDRTCVEHARLTKINEIILYTSYNIRLRIEQSIQLITGFV